MKSEPARQGTGAPPEPVARDERPSLAGFLRHRRERTTPADVGIRAVGRRRTPGLRREELAMLAGVSVDYIIRLEQGRDRNPSLEVLAALGDALGLDQQERAWLRRLAAIGRCNRLCPASPPAVPVQPTTQALIDRLDPTPAVLIERTMDLRAWNASYEWLMQPVGLFDSERPNLLRHLFLEPMARRYFPDWAQLASDLVGQLRAAAVACFVDPALNEVVQQLRAHSRDFARLWAQQDVGDVARRLERVDHPLVGRMEFGAEPLELSDGSGRRLLTLVPTNDQTKSALESLPPAASRSIVEDGQHSLLIA